MWYSINRKDEIIQILNTNLKPLYLKVVDESAKHSTPRGPESHLKVLIVSRYFAGLPHLERHRMIQTHLKKIFADKLHALTIIAKTPEEWDINSSFRETPQCVHKK